jgi:hypothetical protein
VCKCPDVRPTRGVTANRLRAGATVVAGATLRAGEPLDAYELVGRRLGADSRWRHYPQAVKVPELALDGLAPS